MPLRMDPEAEVNYRVKLAEQYLADAEGAYGREDYRTTVASSQLAVENAAKAVISAYRIPSWSHDPSHELRDLIEQNAPSCKVPSGGVDFSGRVYGARAR